jgi:hypothetical protein
MDRRSLALRLASFSLILTTALTSPGKASERSSGEGEGCWYGNTDFCVVGGWEVTAYCQGLGWTGPANCAPCPNPAWCGGMNYSISCCNQ